ncbi:MAG: elongation factor P maturation arginine rhamnosyltransferase EarP [Rhodocyclaceae bacterium]|nr:elongation factor P maturation arginine rhamnosyltransferase EarP [Rhodocyclaceae bacterium]
MKQRWDIFCAVVDNYGDIGICWRLARQLAVQHRLAVRLWVDDLRPLARLHPAADAAAARQTLSGVEVRRWPAIFPSASGDDIADVVVEAFACELPPAYLEAMAQRSPPPLWINLEYLSAEPWVGGCHRMHSPHPRLPLTKHFFFPGFTQETGGLLREADYDARRSAFDAAAFRRQLGLPAVAGELAVSLFGYENEEVSGLLTAWVGGVRPIRCLLPEGRLLPQVAAFFGVSAAVPGSHWRQGSLDVHVLPFLPQPDYDELLWSCDLNFVRGEDSFVRAQWAQRPFVWHIYPQQSDHHQIKLEAFLDLWLKGVPAESAGPIRRFWKAWEGGGSEAAWPGFAAVLPVLAAHSEAWAQRLLGQPDLAAQLVSFTMESR